MTTWTAQDIPDQTGRVAIVTGATSGLGLVTATELARHGARVVLAVRNPDAGARTADAIRAVAPASDPQVLTLDLASLDAVHAFATRLGEETERIDLLVNNAGTLDLGPRRVTRDGFEYHLGTNMLGHFALTGLLFPALQRGEAARVVSLSSLTHRHAHLDFDDLQSANDFRATRAYGASKLATTVFGLELDRRLRAVGSPIVSAVAHPGLARTNFTPHAWSSRGRALQWGGCSRRWRRSRANRARCHSSTRRPRRRSPAGSSSDRAAPASGAGTPHSAVRRGRPWIRRWAHACGRPPRS